MKTILVIEDDPAIRNNIALILKSQGFAILQAEDGLTGVELALGSSPDLIVCDIMLPEISGYEILERLRQEPEGMVTPFIFLTALADRSDVRQGMNLGADDYLTKPFTSQDLIGAVNARLQKQQELTEPYRNEMKKAAEKLRLMVYTDLLTNLPNRILFWKLIEDYLTDSGHKSCALLMIKVVNLADLVQNLGQSTSDLLFQSLARSLQSYLQDHDILSRCRPDGFGFLLTHDVESRETIEGWVKTLLNECTQPHLVTQESIVFDIKIGIAQYPLAGTNTPDLVSAAEKILENFPVSTSTNDDLNYAFYIPADHANLIRKDEIRSFVIQALEKKEFVLHYQPIVNTITGRIVGLEALLRSTVSAFQHLSPREFLAIAEESQMLAIDNWVLHTGLRQIKQWHNDFLIPLKLTINLSGRQLREVNCVETIQNALFQANFDPSLLTIDVREADLTTHVDDFLPTFEALSNIGIQFALEEFGTGFSSLTYLNRLPFHYLKIDESIIHALTEDTSGEAIVKAMIAMSQSLKLKVIAEGVETEEQLKFLRKQGCPLMQGFFYSAPLAEGEIQKLLENDRRLT
jgi:diguanylate cyclase (GGDEF)-like protein